MGTDGGGHGQGRMRPRRSGELGHRGAQPVGQIGHVVAGSRQQRDHGSFPLQCLAGDHRPAAFQCDHGRWVVPYAYECVGGVSVHLVDAAQDTFRALPDELDAQILVDQRQGDPVAVGGFSPNAALSRPARQVSAAARPQRTSNPLIRPHA